jgi:hypothetical protein
LAKNERHTTKRTGEKENKAEGRRKIRAEGEAAGYEGKIKEKGE